MREQPGAIGQNESNADRGSEQDGVRWIAILIRQGLLVTVAGIERRYGLKPRSCFVSLVLNFDEFLE